MEFRPATLEDYAAITAVRRRNGLVSAADLTLDEWTHVWMANPARKAFPGLGGALVLVSDQGEIVGTVDQIPQVYEWNGRRLVAQAGSSAAVDPAYRRFSLMLIDAYFGQSDVDLWITTTANPVSSRIWGYYKAEPVPVPWYGEPLTCVMNYPRGVARVLRKRAIPGASVLKYPMGLAAWALDVVRRRNRMGAPPSGVRSVASFDERFDGLWSILRRDPNRLLAVRDRETLAWHFRIPMQRGKAVILVLEEGANLLGYTVLIRSDDKETGRKELTMADLQVASEDAKYVQSLVSGALHAARRLGVDIVEITGLSAVKRRVMEQFRLRSKRRDHCPFFYRARDPALHAALRHPEPWDPSRYDGDASLFSH